MNDILQTGGKPLAFTAASTHGLINLSDYAGKWTVLFCSPGDFNAAQRNHWISLIKYAKEFSKKNIQVIALSTDKNAAHLPWLYGHSRSGTAPIPFPIIDDRKKTISTLLNLSPSQETARVGSIHVLIIAPDQTLAKTLNYPSLAASQINEVLTTLGNLQNTYRAYAHSMNSQPVSSNPNCPVTTPIVGEYVLGDPRNVDPSLLDFVIYAFALIRPDGTFEVYSTRYLRELTDLRVANPNLKVLMAIGGWGAEGFSDAALTPTSRYNFAREARRWVNEYNLDGIDLDWEYPGSSVAGIISRPQDTENFTLLITALRDVLGPDQWITVAGTGDRAYINNVEIDKIAPLINYFNLMSYDFNAGETGETAGRHQSNLFPSDLSLGNVSVNTQVQNLIAAGMPSYKILMGIPFYARYGATSTRTFDDIRQNYLNVNGYTVRFDSVAKAPYIVDASGNFVYSFDNPVSIFYKGRYIEENCLGGIFSWQSAMDSANILAQSMSLAARDLDALEQLLITDYSFTP